MLTLSYWAPLGTKAKDVRVDVTETSVKIALCKEVVFDREWEHPIGEEVEEYDEEEEYNANGGLKFNESDKSFTPIRRKLTYSSWEVTDYDENNRVIRVTAEKGRGVDASLVAKVLERRRESWRNAKASGSIGVCEELRLKKSVG